VNEIGSLVEQTIKEAIDSSAATEQASAALNQITGLVGNVSESIKKISMSMNRFKT
jgi:methyl-accepting chemotaxis protein